MTVASATSTRGVLPLLVLTFGILVASAGADGLVGLTIEHDGSIVVVRFVEVGLPFAARELVRIDASTGHATILSSDTVGSGPPLDTLDDVAVEASGSLVATLPFVGFQKVLRVDAVSGDRSIVSDLAVGSGPTFFPKSIAVGADGTLFVTQDQEFGGDPGVVRVDPVTGDRATVSGSTRGTGPAFRALTSIAVEPAGTLALTEQLLEAVVRIDPATGDRSIVSSPDVGIGPPLPWVVAITAAPDGKLLVADRGGDRFCVPFCPSELCQICIETAPSLIRVEPDSGDRTAVSGGGNCLTVGLLGCVTPYFGHSGSGPRFVAPTDLGAEASGSYVVADGRLGNAAVFRVDPVSGRRRILAHLESASTRATRSLHRSVSRDTARLYRLPDPDAWMRDALGPDYDPLAAMRPDLFFARLSAAKRRDAGERLYAAMSRLMRDVAPSPRPGANR